MNKHVDRRITKLEKGHDRHEAMLYALANAIGVSFVRTKLDAEGKPVAVDKDGNEIPFHPVEKPRIVVPK